MHIPCISSRYIAFKNTSLGDFPGGSVALGSELPKQETQDDPWSGN